MASIQFQLSFLMAILQSIFLFSLFCSLEKSSHAHSDQLLHCELVLCWYPGDNHVSSCKSCGGHYRNMVLWKNPVQDLTLLTGKWTDNVLYVLLIICLALEISTQIVSASSVWNVFRFNTLRITTPLILHIYCYWHIRRPTTSFCC